MASVTPPQQRHLKITPESQLTFDSSLCCTPTSETQTLTLKNTSSSNQNVAFKIKTTAQKAYAVRPSTQIIKAGEERVVEIQLHKKLDGVPKNNEHRFLVQALQCSMEGPDFDREDWTKMEEQAGEQPQHYRFAVVFEDKGGNVTGQNGENNNSVTNTNLQATRNSSQTNSNSGSVNTVTNTNPSQQNHMAGSANSEYNNQGQQSGDSQNTEAKYKELLDYVDVLEDSRMKFETKIKNLKEQLANSNKKKGFQVWQLGVAAFFAIALCKVVDRIMGPVIGTS